MNQSLVLGTIAALLGGGVVSLQAAALAHVGRSAGSIRAGLMTYLAGGAIAGLVLIATRSMASSGTQSPGSGAWLVSAAAGAMGLVIVSTISFSANRVTVAAGLAIMLIGQMLAALALDAGGIGVAAVPVDARRLLGVVVLGIGAWLLVPR